MGIVDIGEAWPAARRWSSLAPLADRSTRLQAREPVVSVECCLALRLQQYRYRYGRLLSGYGTADSWSHTNAPKVSAGSCQQFERYPQAKYVPDLAVSSEEVLCPRLDVH